MTEPTLFDFERADTGIAGLDDVLGGGFPRNRMYLVEGDPGAGKTTLALQFLLAGARRGEPGVYATLSETGEELRDVARAHGWSLDGVTICDLQTAQESLKAESQYTLFHPAEVELSETTRTVLDAVEAVRPRRVVFDSLSEMRLLARDSLRYRRQILALKQYFTGRSCTVLLLDYGVENGVDFQLQSLTHGVVSLEYDVPLYGGQRRRLRVQKVRGIRYREGYHDYVIRRGGVVVYPRLVAAEHRQESHVERVTSSIPELDALLGGGLDRGTSTMLLGPSGSGKSTLAAQLVCDAARRGEKASVYLFEELPANWLARADALGMDMSGLVADGMVSLHQIDPAEMTPGEMAHGIRGAVEAGCRVLLIDSLNGYRNAMPQENFLALHLHELLSYLGQSGVTTLLVMAQHGMLGEVSSPIELTYISDTLLLLRFFEQHGRVHKALSVVKKRTGAHERAIRELLIGSDGVRVGRELLDFQGVLSGQPREVAPPPSLLPHEG